MNAPQTLFYPQTKQIQEVEELDVKLLLYKYLFKHWYWYLLFTCLGISLAYVYLKYTTPIYEVKSSLLIKEDKDKKPSTDDILKGLKLFGTSENVANEIHILNSYSLTKKVINKLNLGISYQWKDWMKEIPSYKNFPIVVDSFELSLKAKSSDKFRLKEGLSLQIKPCGTDKFELLNDDLSMGQFQFGEMINTSVGAFRFLRLQELNLNSDSLMYVTFKDSKLVADAYQKNIKVRLVDKKSSVIELSLKETVPLRAMEVLSSIVELYNAAAIEDKNEISKNTSRFIEERLVDIAKDLNLVEGNIENYKRKNRISTTSEKDLEIVLQEVSKYAESQTELEVQLNILESMDVYLGRGELFDLIPANLSVSNLALKDLITPYNELAMKRQRLLETATISNPLVQSCEQQLISLRTGILHTVNNIKQDLKKKLKSVTEVNSELLRKVKYVPTQERGLLEIKRQQAIKESLYIYLLKKKEETALTLAATTSNARIIDAPRTASKPISPKNTLVYLGSVLGGFLIPFFFIVVKDILQDSIQDEEDIKAITKVPLIGSISKGKKKEHIVIKSNSRTAIAERFRLIRTNLLFAKKKGVQTILITSSISGEGKSFVALNLARSFALTKKKTILIEMDLRKPKLKGYIGESDCTVGITEFIIGKSTLSEIKQGVKDLPNLDYIISGAIPFNPNELLSEHSVAGLFEQLKKEYDVIIIDTPPVGLVSDAFLLNDFITNTVYVVRANITKKYMLTNAHDILQKAKLKNISLLLNGVNNKGSNGYGYYEN